MGNGRERTTRSGSISHLEELPLRANGSRLWDGADRMLLELFGRYVEGEFSSESEAGAGTHDAHALSVGSKAHDVLIMNDASGALLRVLTEQSFVKAFEIGIERLQSFGDDVRSLTQSQVLLQTLGEADQGSSVTFVPSTNVPETPTIVVLRVSPIEAIVRAQIILLRAMQQRGDRFVVIAAGLDRLLPAKTKALLASLGTTVSLPGAYKAHGFLCQLDDPSSVSQPGVPAPNEVAHTSSPAVEVMSFSLGGKTYAMETGPYAFSAGRLDLGSRLLIEALAAAPSFGLTVDGRPGRVADLACGNGVIGIIAAKVRDGGSHYFSDVSFSSVGLAERNAKKFGLTEAEFAVDDGFKSYEGPRFDAVLLNPPFHHHGGVNEELGAQLFAEAHRHLRVGGELWVVGNRHLGYQKTLQTMFGHCRLVTAHPKFVVLVAQRGVTRLRNPNANSNSRKT